MQQQQQQQPCNNTISGYGTTHYTEHKRWHDIINNVQYILSVIMYIV